MINKFFIQLNCFKNEINDQLYTQIYEKIYYQFDHKIFDQIYNQFIKQIHVEPCGWRIHNKLKSEGYE